MITVRTSPAYVNRVRQDWTANGGVYGDGGVYAVVPSNDPFAQLGPTLDLTFAGVPTDQFTAATTDGYSINLNLSSEIYQVAAQYAVWVSGSGLQAKTFSDIVTFSRTSGATWFNSAGVNVGIDFSTSSVTIGTGSKTFTLTATAGIDRSWAAGDIVRISEQATPANFMDGTVTSYTASTQTLVVNVTATGGSGTIASWRVSNWMPRFDYNPSTLAAQGLVIEEQRTNSIRNNTMVGGGSGVEPTNWTANGATGNGITLTVVGVGIENGIAYVDYEINGTATITGTAISIVFDTTTGIAASATQVWAWSSYLKLAAGTLTDLAFTPRISWRDSGGGAISSNDGTSVPTGAALSTQRFSFSATAPASTGYVQPQLRIGTVNGSTYTGVQIRIGLPQLELGAFATSVIPTTVAAATRNPDQASVNTLSPWYNASEGTLFAEVGYQQNNPSVSQIAASFNDTTANNRWTAGFTAPTGLGTALRNTSGAGLISTSTANTATVGATNKIALAISTGASLVLNGGTVATNASYAAPTVTQLQLGYQFTAGYFNGYLRRIVYYPRRLANADLQTITA